MESLLETRGMPVSADLHLRGRLEQGPQGLILRADGGGTWELDAGQWVSRPQAPPALTPREDHGMAYDAGRGVTVLYGGDDEHQVRDDTWEYDGAAWRLVPATGGPGRREGPSMAYDGQRKVTVLFGGIKSDSGTMTPLPFDDTWEWDGKDWKKIATAQSATARHNGGMAYDAKRGRIVLFGGGSLSAPNANLVWEYDGTTWTSATSSPAPIARHSTAMAYAMAMITPAIRASSPKNIDPRSGVRAAGASQKTSESRARVTEVSANQNACVISAAMPA